MSHSRLPNSRSKASSLKLHAAPFHSGAHGAIPCTYIVSMLVPAREGLVRCSNSSKYLLFHMSLSGNQQQSPASKHMSDCLHLDLGFEVYINMLGVLHP